MSMNEILGKLNNKGFDAFLVGGYVRDLLLNRKSYDIDICTNANIDNIIKVLGKHGKVYKEYFSYHFNKDEYDYEITTFRKELEYKNNKPIKIIGVNSLYIDLLRRDFTINTICMDKDNNIIDLLDGIKDLNNKVIKTVGNTYERFNEDKTRIVRAIRLSCTLNFDLDSEIVNYIKEYGKYIKDLNSEYKKKELDKIFNSNPNKFFIMSDLYNFRDLFDINYDNNIIIDNIYSIWAQIDSDYTFNKDDKLIINSIKKLVKKKDITSYDIYKYGEFIALSASKILNIDISNIINNLKIHSILDIDITSNEIEKLVSKNKISEVYKLLEKNILNNSLNNNKCDIINFIKGEYHE